MRKNIDNAQQIAYDGLTIEADATMTSCQHDVGSSSSEWQGRVTSRFTL